MTLKNRFAKKASQASNSDDAPPSEQGSEESESDAKNPTKSKRLSSTLTKGSLKEGPIGLKKKITGTPFVEKDPSDQILHVIDASMAGKLKKLKKYIDDLGFDLKNTDKYGRSILIYPCIRGQVEVVKYLVNEKEMNPNDLDKKKRTALHWLATTSTPKNSLIFKLLLEAGVNMDQQDEEGNTALMIACQNPSQKKLIQLMCFNGAKKSIKNKKEKNAIHLAREAGGPVWAMEVAKVLKHRRPGEALRAKKRLVEEKPEIYLGISGLTDEELEALKRSNSKGSLMDPDSDDLEFEEELPAVLTQIRADLFPPLKNPIRHFDLDASGTPSTPETKEEDTAFEDEFDCYDEKGFMETVWGWLLPDMNAHIKHCPCCNGLQMPPPQVLGNS